MATDVLELNGVFRLSADTVLTDILDIFFVQFFAGNCRWISMISSYIDGLGMYQMAGDQMQTKS